MSTRIQALAVRAVAVGMCVILSTTRASAEPLWLDVFVSDDVRVDPRIIVGARQTVARIFGRFDVQIVWFDREAAQQRTRAFPDEAARRAFLTSLFTIRLVPAVRTNRGNVPSASALGFAVPGTHVASVILPRIEQLASGGDVCVVLGHVMAHELGHLLLRQNAHSLAGLMQAEFDNVLAQQGRLLFSDDQAQAIRAMLAADAKPGRETQIEAPLARAISVLPLSHTSATMQRGAARGGRRSA